LCHLERFHGIRLDKWNEYLGKSGEIPVHNGRLIPEQRASP